MSSGSSELHFVCARGTRTIRIEVEGADLAPSSTSGNHHEGDDDEWELVEPSPQPLTVSSEPPPLHLLTHNKLVDLVGFSGEDRIRRAFRFGQTDCEAALLGSYQKPVDRFPLKSSFYVILYNPDGSWPRVIRDLATFYRVVKIETRGRAPDRSTPWKQGIVSRGFATQTEAEAYLLGARCPYPKES